MAPALLNPPRAHSILHFPRASPSSAGKSRLEITRRSLRVKLPTVLCHSCFMQLKNPAAVGGGLCEEAALVGDLDVSQLVPNFIHYVSRGAIKYQQDRPFSGKGRQKSVFSQSTKASVVIHPLCDTAKRVPSGPPNVISALSRSPLYTTYGGRSWPAADMHVCTVTFSLPKPATRAWGVYWPRRVRTD